MVVSISFFRIFAGFGACWPVLLVAAQLVDFDVCDSTLEVESNIGAGGKQALNLKSKGIIKKMRVMVIIKTSEESEAGLLPSQKLLAEMGKFNAELVKAGLLLAAKKVCWACRFCCSSFDAR